MPSIYIILEKQIPNVDVYVNGNSLSKNGEELEKMARRLGVRPLMDFFSTSYEELSSLVEEYGSDLNKTKAAHEEKWFAAEEGLQTVEALLQDLASSKLDRLDRVKAELQEFAKVLEVAKANGVRWHIGVDY